jgi:hypothetical protein
MEDGRQKNLVWCLIENCPDWPYRRTCLRTILLCDEAGHSGLWSLLEEKNDFVNTLVRSFLSSSSSFLFFFLWHCSRLWTTASSKIVLHWSLSCYCSLHFPTPIMIRSSPTDSSHPNLSFPTCPLPSALRSVSRMQGSSSCILKRCSSHLNLPTFCHHNYV